MAASSGGEGKWNKAFQSGAICPVLSFYHAYYGCSIDIKGACRYLKPLNASGDTRERLLLAQTCVSVMVHAGSLFCN